MPTNASLRALVAGSGTMTVSSAGAGKPARLVFSLPQSLKKGETIQGTNFFDGSQYVIYGRHTVSHGAGTEWMTAEPFTVANTVGSFRRTDPGPSRARGTDAVARYVPGARHFFYVAPVDAAGFPDCYAYVDTIFPERGVHPYTRDPWTGLTWIAKDDIPTANGVLVADLANRLAALDALPPVLSL